VAAVPAVVNEPGRSRSRRSLRVAGFPSVRRRRRLLFRPFDDLSSGPAAALNVLRRRAWPQSEQGLGAALSEAAVVSSRHHQSERYGSREIFDGAGCAMASSKTFRSSPEASWRGDFLVFAL
jgi:hypothetical protein